MPDLKKHSSYRFKVKSTRGLAPLPTARKAQEAIRGLKFTSLARAWMSPDGDVVIEADELGIANSIIGDLSSYNLTAESYRESR